MTAFVFFFFTTSRVCLHRICSRKSPGLEADAAHVSVLKRNQRGTFHWSTREFLVPLAFLGALGGSGSQLSVVKLTASDGLPCKQLHMAWTLKVGERPKKRLAKMFGHLQGSLAADLT